MRFIFAALITCLALGTMAWASDGDIIGSVRTAQGECTITRGTETLAATIGTHLRQHDLLATGKDSSMGVLLRDDTSISLGDESEVVLDEFLFDPANDELGLSAQFLKGTAAVLTGSIAEMAPEKTDFSTPLASIGIRGTRFAVKVGK